MKAQQIPYDRLACCALLLWFWLGFATSSFARQQGDFDEGYKQVKWGMSADQAKALILEKLHPNYPVIEYGRKWQGSGHSYFTLQYYGKVDGVIITTKYDFIDQQFFRVEKNIDNGDSEIQKAYIDEMTTKLNRQYGKPKKKGVWVNNYASIDLYYRYENHGYILGESYRDTRLTVESIKLRRLFDKIEKEVEELAKKRESEDALKKAKRILD